ncbi:hypothetical protein WN51_06046 [Melipona quadrifasciata]|uniref:Uncharacterized protein n=1 Tax=Melipona quadrifasciata TaxID=166423 RepID=A0A0N0U3T1_9HYME|nr:hypothetical protein WN51_06046 [Melipona quadrifasciata]
MLLPLTPSIPREERERTVYQEQRHQHRGITPPLSEAHRIFHPDQIIPTNKTRHENTPEILTCKKRPLANNLLGSLLNHIDFELGNRNQIHISCGTWPNSSIMRQRKIVKCRKERWRDLDYAERTLVALLGHVRQAEEAWGVGTKGQEEEEEEEEEVAGAEEKIEDEVAEKGKQVARTKTNNERNKKKKKKKKKKGEEEEEEEEVTAVAAEEEDGEAGRRERRRSRKKMKYEQTR